MSIKAIILEDSPQEQKKKAVVVLGRFNPPTKGHSYLLNQAKKAFRNHKMDAVVLVVIDGKSTSKNKMENPLSAEDRIKFLKETSHGKGVKYIVAGSAYDAFIKVREAGYEPMIVVAGNDRCEKYVHMLDKYFKDADGEPIKHIGVELKRDDKSEGVAGISATLARVAAKLGKFDDFLDIVDVPEEVAEVMYKKIRKAMGLE